MQNIKVDNWLGDIYRSPKNFGEHIVLGNHFYLINNGCFGCCQNQTSLKWSWAKIRMEKI